MAAAPVLPVFCVIEFVGPAMEEAPHLVDVDVGLVDGEFVVGEAVDGPHHFCEDERIKSEVDLGCTLKEYGSVEALCEREDVSEVACLGTIEPRHQLSSGEFLGIECGSDDRDDRGSSRWGVDGDVDNHFVIAGYPEPNEGVTVLDAGALPAVFGSRSFEPISCGADVDGAWIAEEVEVLRWSCGQP